MPINIYLPLLMFSPSPISLAVSGLKHPFPRATYGLLVLGHPAIRSPPRRSVKSKTSGKFCPVSCQSPEQRLRSLDNRGHFSAGIISFSPFLGDDSVRKRLSVEASIPSVSNGKIDHPRSLGCLGHPFRFALSAPPTDLLMIVIIRQMPDISHIQLLRSAVISPFAS